MVERRAKSTESLHGKGTTHRTGVVWLRRDLRVHDHPALTAARAECDEVIPLFVFDEPLLRTKQFGSFCITFMMGCLEDLRRALTACGLTLQWRRGTQHEEVVRFVQDVHAQAVYWNRDYDPVAKERDATLEQALGAQHVVVRTFKDHVVFEAEEIRGATGNPLQRYSAYRARWWAAWHRAPPPCLPPLIPLRRPHKRTSAPASAFPTIEALGYQRSPLAIRPGATAAQQRLQWFLAGPIQTYGTGRNLPAIDGTSKLSPHFRFGTLSIRTAVHAALETLTTRTPLARRAVVTWIDELIWREFFQQILSAFPHVTAGPFRHSPGIPRPRRAGPTKSRLYAAWCDGKTGYPLVDAGMRQLNQTGWMHNRVRMVVASFLIKDLRLEWQQGERYFMHHLLDADVGANNGNWQWAASTGTDAMPRYRIFNPLLQSQRFDPNGAYIRHYVPELAAVPLPKIHAPSLMTPDEQRRSHCRIGIDYPAPIVNHQDARDEYLARGGRQGNS